MRSLWGLVFGTVFVLAVSHIGALLIYVDRFDPWITLVAGTLVTLCLGRLLSRWLPHQPGIMAARHPRLVDLLVLIAVAILFRYAPLDNIIGSRDDGVYANMGAHLMQASGPTHQDPTLPRLPGSDGQFLATRHPGSTVQVFGQYPPAWENRFEGNYLPGVYIADAETGTYVFQFLHVHPVWLSIGGAVLGRANMGYVIIAGAVVAVLLLYLLILWLTGHRWWALAGGLTLAGNPLHAFLSRNTLSEPTALLWALLMLALLVAAWRVVTDLQWRRLLVLLAVGMFSVLCLTRIDGFFFLPFFAGAALYAMGKLENRNLRQLTLFGLLGMILVYGVSVHYARTTSFCYTTAQFDKIFSPLLGAEWAGTLLPLAGGLLVVLAAILIPLAWRRRPAPRLVQALDWLGPAAAVVMLLGIAVHVYKVWGLATHAAVSGAADHVGYVARFDLAGHGWASAAFSSLVNAAVYLSPFLLGLVVWRLLSWRRRDPVWTLLILLNAGFFLYAAIFQWVLPFQFYYGRYLLSAFLPFSLLLVFALAPSGRRSTPAVWTLVILGFLWSTALSGTQFRYGGYRDLGRGLEDLAELVGDNDLLIINEHGINYKIYTTPLIYSFGRNVWTASSLESIHQVLKEPFLTQYYDNVLLLSARDPVRPWLVEVANVDLNWSRAKESSLMPWQVETVRLRANLHRFAPDRLGIKEEVLVADRARSGLAVPLDGLPGNRIWTGANLQMRFIPENTDYKLLSIHLEGWRPEVVRKDLERTTIHLNGQLLPLATVNAKLIECPIPAGLLIEGENLITMDVPTFVPAEHSASSTDQRSLGLDIAHIVLK